jgi:hypothetical protein
MLKQKNMHCTNVLIQGYVVGWGSLIAVMRFRLATYFKILTRIFFFFNLLLFSSCISWRALFLGTAT